jgi:hypothetical protein
MRLVWPDRRLRIAPRLSVDEDEASEAPRRNRGPCDRFLTWPLSQVLVIAATSAAVHALRPPLASVRERR